MPCAASGLFESALPEIANGRHAQIEDSSLGVHAILRCTGSKRST
jgi:hypothetical protein